MFSKPNQRIMMNNGCSPMRDRLTSRVLIRPEPGFYVVRQSRHGPIVPALICQRCPMVLPQPGAAGGPHPDDWCRPLDRSPGFLAQINGRVVPIDRVWTARSLRPVSAAEYAFRIGPLRRWARTQRSISETQPHRHVNLAALPPLF
jgi:hypothetical protein